MDTYPPETRDISTEMTSHREDDIPGQHSMDDLYKTANGDILSAMMQESLEQGLVFPSGPLSGLDFKIVVPEIREVKEGLLKNYMVYTIVLSVKDREGNWKEFQVHRRYSDFDWFFENLCSKYSGYVIPMPPPKNFLTVVGQTDQDFVETRKRELILFLNKCIQHPFLRNTAELKIFLSDDKGFVELKNKEQALEKKKGFGFLSNITKMISGASKDTIFEHAELDDDDTNLLTYKLEFDRSKELLEKFSSSLTNYLSANKKQDEVLRPFMRGLEATLTQVSSATEFNEAFRKMAKSEKAQIDADLNRDINLRLDRNLKSILSNIESANLAIKRRNLMAKEYDTLNAALEEKRERGIQDKEFKEMEEQFEKVAEKLVKTTETLLKDLALFEEGLQGDIASFFSEFVKRMEHYQRDLAQEADSIRESMKI